MVLRLDPAIPLVWRDPRTLQFGVDPVLAVLADVTPAHERLIAALATGVSDSGFRMLSGTPPLTRRQGEQLLGALAPCLLPEEPPAATRPSGAVVLGDTPLALALARLLDDAGLRRRDRRRRPALVVLVSDRVLRPADHRPWLQRDIPHLPIVTSDSAVAVGPLVLPGTSACLHCALLHRRDADAAWPAIAAQLATLPAPAPHPLRSAAAVVHAARLVRAALDGEAEPGVEWRLEGDGSAVRRRPLAPHPECRCATPPGSDWAPADDRAAPPPTSAARGSAVPA
jgi:bacteriocin biosynthesis cyclodehydratase domain-containing protein